MQTVPVLEVKAYAFRTSVSRTEALFLFLYVKTAVPARWAVFMHVETDKIQRSSIFIKTLWVWCQHYCLHSLRQL